MTTQSLRWGILSTAKIARRAVIPAIQHSNNGIVAAIASRDAQTAQATAQALNIPRAFASYEALLESPEIDAVYIPLPNHLHKEWAIRAAQHGKHILCEKPFALNVGEVDEMIAAAKQHRVLLMEAFMYRFHPQFARVRELITAGAIGKVQVIRSAFCYTMNRPNDIRAKKEMGGGALMDVGCYCVNVSRLIAGTEPRAVQATMIERGSDGVDDAFAGILHFPNEVLGIFDCSFRTDYTEWLQIQGTEGRLDVPRPFKPLAQVEIILHTGEKGDAFATQTSISVPSANHYQLMVEHFADAVLQGTPLQYPPELDRNNMQVIDALYQSARQ